MDSKLTLVDSSNRQFIQLVFSRNSITNADIIINGRVRYTISTKDRHAQMTKIFDVITNTEFVSIERRMFLPDKIVFGSRGGVERKMSDVIKRHKLDDGYTAHTIHTDLGDIYWKVHKIYRLALFSTSDPIEPIAYREQLSHPISTFALTVRKEYESLLNYIIPTFLYLERDLRGGEKPADFGEGVGQFQTQMMANFVNTSTL